MAPFHITRDEVIAQFDSLVQRKELFWKPSQPIYVSDCDIPSCNNGKADLAKFYFRVVPATKTKPSYPERESSGNASPNVSSGAGQTPTGHQQANQTDEDMRSDIDNGDPNFHISNILNSSKNEATHRLIHNKYCIFRPQYILMTKSPIHLQTDSLTDVDFYAAWQVLQTLCRERPHYVIFNCAKAAGGSRMHKHMQIFEIPEETSMLLPDTYLVQGKTPDTCPLPYKLFFERHELDSGVSPTVAGKKLAELYNEQCAKSREVFKPFGEDQGSETEDFMPHNMILTQTSLTTIPRRAAGVGPATANAAGMVGLVWVFGDDVLRLWKNLGPAKVLATLGIPNGRVEETAMP